MRHSLMAVEFGAGNFGSVWAGSTGNTVLPCFIIAFKITKCLSYEAVDLPCLTIIQPAVDRRLI